MGLHWLRLHFMGEYKLCCSYLPEELISTWLVVTALAAAVFGQTRHSTDIVSLLLGRGADINAVGGEYGTTLAEGRTQIVLLLLDCSRPGHLHREYKNRIASAEIWG